MPYMKNGSLCNFTALEILYLRMKTNQNDFLVYRYEKYLNFRNIIRSVKNKKFKNHVILREGIN